MSLTKSEVAQNDYIKTGNKAASKGTAKQLTIKAANQLSTSSLIWLIVKRHKVGLLAIGNIVLVMNFVLPEWPQMALGLINK